MRTPIIIKSMLTIVLLAALSAAPAVFAGDQDAKTLRIAYDLPAATLDPHITNQDANLQLAASIFDKLLWRNADYKLEYRLAKHMEAIASDTWQLILRDDVRFSDGSNLTSDDFIATVNRVQRLKKGMYPNVAMIDSIERVSDHEVRIKTKEAYPLLPNSLALVQILSAHQPGIEGDGELPLDHLIGTGPYRVKEWTKERLQLERNPYYWEARPEWDEIEFRMIPDENARYQALLKGEVDFVAGASAAHLKEIAANPRFHGVAGDSYLGLFLVMDQFREGGDQPDQELKYLRTKSGASLPVNPLKEKVFRQALSLTINRSRIVEQVFSGSASPLNFLAPTATQGVRPGDSDPKSTQDLQKANQMIDDLAKSDPKLSFLANRDMKITFQTATSRAELAAAIAEDWRKLGFDVDFQLMPAPDLLGRGGSPGFEFQIPLVSWGADSGELSSTLKAMVASRSLTGFGGSNRGRYSNPQVDDLLRQALSEMNDTKRTEILRRAAEISMADAALIPLVSVDNIWLMRANLDYPKVVPNHTIPAFIRPRAKKQPPHGVLFGAPLCRRLYQ